MAYYLHPSVNITEISPVKTQVAHIGHEITIEEQNENILEFVALVEKSDFPACLKTHEKAELFESIFQFFVSHNFITQKKPSDVDALALDLQVLNGIANPEYQQETPKLLKEIDFSSVCLFGEGTLLERVYTELSQLGIQVQKNPTPEHMHKGLIVCCSDQPNARVFKEINQLALSRKQPALFANLNGRKGLVGPFVMPNESSCYTCYTHRLAPNVEFIEESQALQEKKGNVVASQASPSLYALATSYHVLSQILKFQNRSFDLCLINEVFELDLLDFEIDVRPVIRVPHCEDCYAERNAMPTSAVRALI